MGIALSNLPPGASPSMLPGNRDEDTEWEAFMDWAWDYLADSNLDTKQAKRAILIGVKQVKVEISKDIKAIVKALKKKGAKR